MDIAQEQEFRIRIFRRNTRLEAFEHIQFGEIGLGFIEVVEILPTPAEGVALGTFDATSIDLSFLENILVLGREVFAHHGDNANVREIAGRQGKERAGTAQYIFYPPGRRGNRVEGNRTYGKDAHYAVLVSRYFPRISFSFSRVAARILSRSVRIA